MRFFFLFIFSSLFSDLPNINLNAKAAILINGETGAILYEKNAHQRMYPASITKVATALFSLEEKKAQWDQKMTVSAEALKKRPEKETGEEPPYWDESVGTKMWLVSREVLPFGSLLNGMIRCSGNDAANVIAENLSDSIPLFVTEMNEYLLKIGCRETNFKNPHGIHHKDHYTTAYDLGIVFLRALAHPKFREVSSNSSYQRPKTNKQPGSELLYQDPLLIKGKYYYPKVFSVKKGFHSEAKHTIAAAATDEGRTLIAVLLGCETTADRCKDTITLFERAFKEKKEKKVLFRAFSPIQIEVKGSKKGLKTTVLSDIKIEYFPSEEPACKALVRLNKKILPVKKGETIGVIEIQDASGRKIEQGDLVSMENLKLTLFEKLSS